jgi:biotin-dependent carboxylase-like uncharacterized protein
VRDVVVTERHVLVAFDSAEPPTGVEAAIERGLDEPASASATRDHAVRVRYDGSDLSEVAALAGLTPAEVAAMHSRAEYVVAAVGFLPGFAYLRGLDARLFVPRRATPRTRISPLSVGIAGPYTGLSLRLRGGLELDRNGGRLRPLRRAVGRRAEAGRSCALRAVRGADLGHGVGDGMIEITSVAGLATVQDLGRPGHMHEGVPPGGALVPEGLALANAAARNRDGEAAIELIGSIRLRAVAPVLVATDDGDSRMLDAGDTLAFPPDSRGTPTTWGRRLARYVAVRGGVDVPVVLDGQGTLLVAGIGGHEGRALRRGDVLGIGHSPVRRDGDAPPARPDLDGPIRVLLGPDLDRFEPGAIDTLLRQSFEIDSRSDRIGTRLSGPRLVRIGGDSSVSSPMVRGAIQVPGSGQPIVLGPDHPTTGGYPVIATVVRASLGALSGRPLGARVRFERQD